MAQTYTHGLTSLAVVSWLLPQHLLVQFSFVVGSVLPDLVTFGPDAGRVFWNEGPLALLKSLPALMKAQTPQVMRRKEISHSLLLWGFACLMLMGLMLYPENWWIFAVFAGLFSHGLTDVFTHGKGDKFEPRYCWPLLRPRLGDRFGICDYRIGPGVFRPKLLEGLIDITAFAAIVYFQWIGSFTPAW